MSLPADKKRQYRTIGHDLKPVVTVAEKGLSENVLAELERALNDHELIKVKLAIPDREARKSAVEQLSKKTGSIVVQEIGKVALIFREAKKPNTKLSNIR